METSGVAPVSAWWRVIRPVGVSTRLRRYCACAPRNMSVWTSMKLRFARTALAKAKAARRRMWGSARFKDWEYGGPGDEGIVVFVGVFSDEGGEDRVGSALDCPCGVEVTTKTFEANVVRTDVANVSAELVDGDEEIFRGFGRAEGEGGVGRAVVKEEEDAAVTFGIGWEG